MMSNLILSKGIFYQLSYRWLGFLCHRYHSVTERKYRYFVDIKFKLACGLHRIYLRLIICSVYRSHIRPLEVSPLNYSESVQKPWGFFRFGRPKLMHCMFGRFA